MRESFSDLKYIWYWWFLQCWGGGNETHTYLPEEFLAASTIVRREVDVNIVVLCRQRFLHKWLVEHFPIHLYSVLGRLTQFILCREGITDIQSSYRTADKYL